MSSNIPHDLGYKYLFSHPDFVRDLDMGFIEDHWLHSLDYWARQHQLRHRRPGCQV